MKQISTLIILICVCCFAVAQTQQGIVKTRGRVVNGQVVPGTRLTGATVTLNFGNPLVSGNNGTFSFNVPSGKNYSLVAAKKQGYTLADPEYTRRLFTYSAHNPFYIVLEDEAQRQADIKAVTDKLRKTLKREIRKREDELDELRESNTITQAKYDSLRVVFLTYRQRSENLVQEMAERYTSTDYDQLDEFNRQVQMYIEEGELQKADSMIRSKGSMEERVAEYHSIVTANKKEREALEQRQQSLELSENVAFRTYEDLSQDLLRRSEIFLQVYKQDSALYSLKLRADLDTTKVEAVKQYAELCLKQNKFKDCNKYYLICLRKYIVDNDSLRIAEIYNALGYLYSNCHDFTTAERYYVSSLKCLESFSCIDNEQCRADLASVQNNLSILFCDMHDYGRCEQYAKMSQENYEILYEENQDKYCAQYARSQNNIAKLYAIQKNYEKAKIYFKSALDKIDVLYAQNPDGFRLEKAMIHTNLGILCMQTKDYENSENQMKLGLELKEYLCSKNPDAYTEELARMQKNLGNLYITTKKNTDAEKYLELALGNIEKLFVENPNIYRLELSFIQNSLGILYRDSHDYFKSKKYLMLAVENKEKLFRQNPIAYRHTLSITQNNIVSLCKEIQDYDDCLKYGYLLLVNLEELNKKNPDKYSNEIANAQKDIAYAYLCKKQYSEAIELIDKAISLLSNNAEYYDTKGEIFLMQGKHEEALAMWKRVLELNPDFLKENPNGTGLSNGLKKLGLIE